MDCLFFSICAESLCSVHVSLNLVFLHSAIDVSEYSIQNQSKPEEITLREDYKK